MTASRSTAPFSVAFADIPKAETIELRFSNDLWSADANGGDRNVFVTNVAVNGNYLPMDRYKVVKESAGIVTQNGAALYQNGSIVIRGPFVDACK
jgi:hypothetical protein